MFSAGDTFLIKKKTDLFFHLWILLLDPEPDGRTIMVNATSRNPNMPQELTVILNASDHPALTHESIVYYSDARFVNVNEIQAALAMPQICIQKAKCQAVVLQKVQAGLLVSTFTPIGVQEYYSNRTQGTS